jgi:peroxiredoxin
MRVFHIFVMLGCLAATSAFAQTIRLTDQTSLQGDVVQVNDDGVMVRIPRERVATVDGKALPQALVVGVAAPAFSAKDLNGQTHAVGQAKGQVTVLHFWVHWCPHCRSDAPQIQALYNALHETSGIRIVTVNLDQDRAKVEQFVKEHKVTYPVIFAAEQAALRGGVDLTALYQITGFPVTYLIDAQGIIQKKFTGSFTESGVDIKSLVSELAPKKTNSQ